ncbi:MAG: hypothetical protein Q8R15_00840 [Candidatus Micrarchaeota archaeon]|nr:hypothetical protein [Candidatus Micrarchaeota archaeon]
MAKVSKHERIAIKKHEELIKLPVVGLRLVDHNLMHELDKMVAHGTELNVIDEFFPDKPGYLPRPWSAFGGLQLYWGSSRYGVRNGFDHLTAMTNTGAHIERFWNVIETYFGYKGRSSKTGLKGRQGFERFKKDLLQNKDLCRVVGLLPDTSDPKEVQRIAKSWDPADWHQGAANSMVFYAAHHARTLQQLFGRQSEYGKKPGEKIALIRAVAYFLSGDHSPHSAPLKTNFSRIANFGRPYDYTAAAFIHPRNMDSIDVYGWRHVKRGKELPIAGMVVLEPTTHAATDAAKRMLSHLRKKKRLKEAFPVYDYRFRRIWPPISSQEKKTDAVT